MVGEERQERVLRGEEGKGRREKVSTDGQTEERREGGREGVKVGRRGEGRNGEREGGKGEGGKKAERVGLGG